MHICAHIHARYARLRAHACASREGFCDFSVGRVGGGSKLLIRLGYSRPHNTLSCVGNAKVVWAVWVSPKTTNAATSELGVMPEEGRGELIGVP